MMLAKTGGIKGEFCIYFTFNGEIDILMKRWGVREELRMCSRYLLGACKRLCCHHVR